MVREIPLTQGYVALVDDEDYDRVMQFKWHVDIEKRPGKSRPDVLYARRSYKVGGKKVRCERMHHFILGSRERVDHADLNGLNNQRSNLRHVSASQNCANRRKSQYSRSQYKGVSYVSERGNWRVVVGHHGKSIHVGCFRDEEEAARAYDERALAIHGEFARLNFPEGSAE